MSDQAKKKEEKRMKGETVRDESVRGWMFPNITSTLRSSRLGTLPMTVGSVVCYPIRLPNQVLVGNPPYTKFSLRSRSLAHTRTSPVILY